MSLDLFEIILLVFNKPVLKLGWGMDLMMSGSAFSVEEVESRKSLSDRPQNGPCV